MKRFFLSFLMGMMPFITIKADALIGKAAPTFELKDAQGNLRTLSEAKGKWLVLEWFNKECPFVKKHYESGNMQSLQKKYIGEKVLWFSVNSSAKGKQGHQTPEESAKTTTDLKSLATALLIDESGVMGKAYDAKTTPHIFLIDPKGVVVYAGAIDDNNSPDPKVIPSSKNYLSAALEEGLAGKAIKTQSSIPYGCGVKY